MKPINLIQTKSATSAQTEIVATVLRRISLWTLATLIVGGVAVSGIFYYVRAREEQLAQTKLQLTRTITQNATKEGLLASVKQRAGQITKILAVQKPVSTVFDVLVPFVSPGQISSVSLDETNKVSLMIHTQSITEAVSITDALVRETILNTVRSPQLISLVLGKDGGIDIGVSFIAVFH